MALKTLDTETTRELLERLRKLRGDARPLWGKMNAHQMVCHLSDAYDLALGQKTASEQITFLNRTLIRWVALRAPMTWPKEVPTRPEMDQLIGGTKPTEFARDVEALTARIQRFGRRPRDFELARHPIFGLLSEWEWMRWGYLHADHHFRQFGV